MTPFVKTNVASKFVCFTFPAGDIGFDVTYSVSTSKDRGFSGRNFMFSGNTQNTLSLFYTPCYHCPDPAPCDPNRPSINGPNCQLNWPPEPVTGKCMACGG